MDSVGSRLLGQIPALENLPPHYAAGSSGMHMYLPWGRYGAPARGELDLARGFHIVLGGGRRMPGPGSFDGLEGLTSGSFGAAFKDDCRRYYGSFVGFSGRGEMIPNKDCYCEIDPDRNDRFGIPILRFHWRWSEHELNQARHMQRTFRDIIGAMGGRMASPFIERGEDAIAKPGEIIHEVGGAIMGDVRATSVVNQFGQAWEVSNLFLTDGAPFVSNADKNPTLSIMALAWRSSDHLIGQMRGRDL
jgi:choline dehydrogenase-like flavoprotein